MTLEYASNVARMWLIWHFQGKYFKIADLIQTFPLKAPIFIIIQVSMDASQMFR